MLWREGEAVSPSLLEAAMDDELLTDEQRTLLLLAGWKVMPYNEVDLPTIACDICKRAGYYMLAPGARGGSCPTQLLLQYGTTAPNASQT